MDATALKPNIMEVLYGYTSREITKQETLDYIGALGRKAHLYLNRPYKEVPDKPSPVELNGKPLSFRFLPARKQPADSDPHSIFPIYFVAEYGDAEIFKALVTQGAYPHISSALLEKALADNVNDQEVAKIRQFLNELSVSSPTPPSQNSAGV